MSRPEGGNAMMTQMRANDRLRGGSGRVGRAAMAGVVSSQIYMFPTAQSLQTCVVQVSLTQGQRGHVTIVTSSQLTKSGS
jgi:hypothetical protein